jgi:hypothetical protein
VRNGSWELVEKGRGEAPIGVNLTAKCVIFPGKQPLQQGSQSVILLVFWP